MRVASFTNTPSDPLAKFLLLASMTLYPTGLEVLVPKVKKHNNNSIELETKSADWPLWVPHAYEPIGKKQSYCIGWGD